MKSHYILDHGERKMNSAIIFILLCSLAICLQKPIRTEQNQGLQQFQEVGYLLEDVVPARLLVEITLQPALKAVYKVESFVRLKDANTTTLEKALQAVEVAAGPARERSSGQSQHLATQTGRVLGRVVKVTYCIVARNTRKNSMLQFADTTKSTCTNSMKTSLSPNYRASY